jgi:hypothetical protein
MEWVSTEMPEWVSGYNYIYLIKLNKSNILELRSEEDILAFGEKYAFGIGGSSFSASMYIDWAKVSNDYAGVEICPYQYGLRMDGRTGWYYGWDVASGCVWDPAGVDVNFIGFWDNENEKIVSKDEIIKPEASGLNWYKKSKFLAKYALVGPDQMDPQISTLIQSTKGLLNQVKLGIPNQDFSGFGKLQEVITQLNNILRSNPDTKFVPIKSHADQLIQTLNLCSGKLRNNMLAQQDISALMNSISNYEGDLNSVL